MNIPLIMGQNENKKDRVIWMPKQEYDAWKKLSSELTENEKRKMAYFFWNNFSMEGYEDYLKKTI